MKRIGVLTSGGDCPGLNTGLRAVVRTALNHNLKVFGIRRGWKGLMAGEVIPLRRLTAPRLRQALQRVLSEPAYRDRAGLLAREIAGENGLQRAGEIVESAL